MPSGFGILSPVGNQTFQVFWGPETLSFPVLLVTLSWLWAIVTMEYCFLRLGCKSFFFTRSYCEGGKQRHCVLNGNNELCLLIISRWKENCLVLCALTFCLTGQKDHLCEVVPTPVWRRSICWMPSCCLCPAAAVFCASRVICRMTKLPCSINCMVMMLLLMLQATGTAPHTSDQLILTKPSSNPTAMI